MSVLREGDGFSGAGDEAFEALMRAHEGLGDDESAALNARLVLVLANEIGDLDRLRAAIRLAREAARPAPGDPATRLRP